MSPGHLVKLGASRLLPRSVLMRGSQTRSEIAISFDDGPHPQQTPLLLEALAEAEVSATFFLQGDHAAKWPALVRDIHRAGHQVANHGYLHHRARGRTTLDVIDDVERTQSLLQDLVGAELRRDFRPPYGNTTLRAFAGLASRGYRFVFWTVDSLDSFCTDASSLISQFANVRVHRGDIVLFHEDYAHTVSAIPAIVGQLQSAGFSLRKVDQL